MFLLSFMHAKLHNDSILVSFFVFLLLVCTIAAFSLAWERWGGRECYGIECGCNTPLLDKLRLLVTSLRGGKEENVR